MDAVRGVPRGAWLKVDITKALGSGGLPKSPLVGDLTLTVVYADSPGRQLFSSRCRIRRRARIMSFVFISTGKNTDILARKLAADLKDRGLQTYLPSQDLARGENFKEKLQEAISKADAYVVVVGEWKKISSAQEAEWLMILDHASHEERKLIPVLVDTDSAPNFLKHWEIISAPNSPKQWRRFVDWITETIQSPARTTVSSWSKQDLQERQRRLEEITHVAGRIKSEGM